MAESPGLEVVLTRIRELMREYHSASRENYLQAPAVLNKITQLTVLRNELDKIGNRVIVKGAVSALGRQMNILARRIAEMPRGDPTRHPMINELAGLEMITESLAKRAKKPADFGKRSTAESNQPQPLRARRSARA